MICICRDVTVPVLLSFTVGVSYQSRVDQPAPSVQDLAKMEKHAQTMFLKVYSQQWLAPIVDL